MSIVVDPNGFKVPYAIGEGNNVHQIADGRPKCDSLFCPICQQPVSFIKEIETRSAHFRHHKRNECDALAAYHREHLHDTVRDAAAALINSGYGAKGICRSAQQLPTGNAACEVAQIVEGRKHRPDILVEPTEDEITPILELEVVFSHKPEPERIERAARNGRLIGIIDIASIEREYYRKLYARENFDIPEACKAFVLDRKFTVMEDADVRRTVRGVLDKRRYLKARVRREHMALAEAPQNDIDARPYTPPVAVPASPPKAPARRPDIPASPHTCAICGAAVHAHERLAWDQKP